MKGKLAVLVAFVAIALAGCGGSDLLSPFAGSFSGTWASVPAATSGNVTMVVLPGGSVSGTITNVGASNNQSATISGTIDAFGQFTGSYTIAGQSALAMSGTFNSTQSGMLGSVSLTTGSGQVDTTFTLSKM